MLGRILAIRRPPLGKLGLLPLALCALLGSSGCGGFGAGDYLVYRVAFAEPSLTADCYGGAVPTDELEDTSTLRASGSFILFAGAGDRFFLDVGQDTLEGSRSGDTFNFAGQSHDVSFNGAPPDELRFEQDASIAIDFALDGALVDGTLVDFQSDSCSGPAGLCPDPPSFSCTRTSTFVGSEVHDVRIEHQL